MASSESFFLRYLKETIKKYEIKKEGKIPCHMFSVCLKQGQEK